MLFWEAKIIRQLKQMTYIPEVYCMGSQKIDEVHDIHCLVTDMLGPSLEELFQKCKTKFDVKTCCLIAK